MAFEPFARLVPTSDAWVRAALADLPTLLVDHAHCERKAAQTALRWMQQRPTSRDGGTRLSVQLSKLAREELIHFERVLGELGRRQVPFVALPAAGYAQALFAVVQGGERRLRTVDELLVCAIIEARSHERFVRLVAALAGAGAEAPLRALYEDLLEAEARHGELYLDLARDAGCDDATLARRLDELLAAEGPIVHREGQPLRMHAGG